MREIAVIGNGGKEPDVGESLGDGGELPFAVELVDGRSLSRWFSFFGGIKALNNGGLGGKDAPVSPKEVEFKLTYLAKEVVRGFPVKTEGFSDENASNGNNSTA